MRIFLQFVIIIFSFQSFAQLDGYLVHNLDLPLPEFSVDLDSSAVSFLKVPFISFQLDLYSKPRISDFIYKKNSILFFNPSIYMNNMSQLSFHHMDMNNQLFYYLKRKKYINYSFGLNHKFLLQGGFSNQFISLILNGNYQYLDQEISLSNNNIKAYNYLEWYFGYSRTINKTFVSAKLKLLNGIASFGFEAGRTSIFSAENSISNNTPFTTLVNSDFNAYYTEDIGFISNLGLALDLSLKYHLTKNISIYSSISDLGFIQWNENQFISSGNYLFNGLDYSIDDNILDGFTNIYDSVVDVFSINKITSIKSRRYLPYETNMGLVYKFNDFRKNQISLNYHFQNLKISQPFSTFSIVYKTYFKSSKLTLAPVYSVNKFSRVNFSLLVNKQWRDSFVTNLYFDNIINLFTKFSDKMHAGLGVEFLLIL
tara:strand:- start:8580 stop:9857 length:1278 start_codon:yes stop_codon:yes gene_type:complete